ncbi:MAG: PAS domain S-box protein [Halioglobus sp.]|nr:PAS domain S-box protein [Halioglobus sp.]
MPEPHRSRHDAYLRRHRETGEARIIGTTRELMAQHRDGRLVPISLSVSEVGHLGLSVGFVRDISALRRLQGEILRATSAERIRIGQALHDGPQQELAGLSLEAAGLTMDLARTSSPYEPRVRALSNGLKEANRHIRHLAQGLVPVQTESVGLMAALEDLARRTHDGDLSCRFVCRNTVEVSDKHIAEQLFHIAREAVANAVKHADADEIVIRLDRVLRRPHPAGKRQRLRHRRGRVGERRAGPVDHALPQRRHRWRTDHFRSRRARNDGPL